MMEQVNCCKSRKTPLSPGRMPRQGLQGCKKAVQIVVEISPKAKLQMTIDSRNTAVAGMNAETLLKWSLTDWMNDDIG